MKFTNFCIVGSGRVARACFHHCLAASGRWIPMIDPEQPTLVVSARNSLIFPPSMTKNENLTIVNFHDSLLPRHRGRNAPAWAIFEQDKVAGVTWHLVTDMVDVGPVLSQVAVPMPPRATAIDLTRQLIDLGIESFRHLLPLLLDGSARAHAALPGDGLEPSYHRGSEKPNGGLPDPAWTADKLEAFERAMNYGGLDPWK